MQSLKLNQNNSIHVLPFKKYKKQCNKLIFIKIRLYDSSKHNSKPLKDIQLKVEKSPLNNILLSNCE